MVLLAAEKDRVAPIGNLQALAARTPDCRVATMPGAGHLAPLEDPELTSRITSGFIDELWV